MITLVWLTAGIVGLIVAMWLVSIVWNIVCY